MQTWCLLESSLTWIGIVGNEQGATHVLLLSGPKESAQRRMRRDFPDAAEAPAFLPAFQRALRDYFDGRIPAFDIPHHLEGLTDFQREVLSACRKIPAGRTLTYAQLAARIGRPRAARAVGNALARNPLPLLIPCHRVVAGNRKLGGFSADAGVDLKRKLLALEGVEI